LILLTFGIFAACCLLQFWFIKQIRDTLIERHPQTFLEIEKSSIFPSRGLWKYTRSNRYKQLGDQVLNRHVRNMKRLMIVAFVSWAAFGITMFAVPFDMPELPAGLANGSYTNSCCGTLALKDGEMFIGKRRIRYVMEQDKQGPYVLPSIYVGVSPHGFVVHDGNPLKLRIDAKALPAGIELMNAEDGSVAVFQRLDSNSN